MKIHRFISDFKLKVGPLRISDNAIVHQIRDVLRSRQDESIELCDGQRTEAIAIIKSLEGDSITVEVGEIRRNVNEPVIEVVLYCAVLKSDNFELVAQKTIETGVSRIIPVLTERTVKEGIRYDRVRRIMKEAAEQSGRGILPVLSEAITLKDAVAHAKSENEIRIFFDGRGIAFEDIRVKLKKSAAIFIGPEGGWDPKEVELAREAGFVIASMGALTLRAETAAIIGSFLVSRL